MIHIQSTSIDNMIPDWQLAAAKKACHTLILVTRGKVVYELEDRPFTLEKGDYFYYPPGMMRTASNAPEGPHQKYFVTFAVSHPNDTPMPDHFCLIRTKHYDYVKQRFIALNQHWFAQMPHYRMICQGIVLELMGYIARESELEQFTSAKMRLMEKVREYMIEHYRESIRIQDLAELIDRAPNYITQTFKQVTGLTPITYMHHLRVQTASTLILNSKMTLGEISEYLGYNDQSHFYRMFKKITGYPPSALLQ